MSATILTGFAGAFEFEPEITSDTSRDGITAFQFKIIGTLSNLNTAFLPDEQINEVPDQPSGNFRVVRRNLEHIAGDPETGLYRLSVSGEGGTGDTALFVQESSYAMQNQTVQGLINLPLAQIQIQYNLIWLYPSVTITTNSQENSPRNAEEMARANLEAFQISIVKDRPTAPTTGLGAGGIVVGPKLAGNPELNRTYITGSSVEKAGGLYRVRATASKGLVLL
jgi:hypothetical protein